MRARPVAGHRQVPSSATGRRGAAAMLALALTLAAVGCTSPSPTTAADDATLTTFSYGPRPAQTADLILPAPLATRTGELRTPHEARGGGETGEAVDVVVLIHGGGWGAEYDRSSETAVARDLTDDGIVVWNLDYRGVGAADPADEGGWPGTFEDVAAGLDLLPEALGTAGLTPGRVAVVGHSAGGTMALWLAARHTLPDGAPGASPLVRPDLVVTQAGVNDLMAAGAVHGSRGPVEALMGGSTSEITDDRYDLASPTARLPLGVPTLVTTGDLDAVVLPSVATGYAEAARAAGDDVTLAVIPGEDHLSPQNPRSGAWAAVRDWLAERGITAAGSTR
ncbi:alpha/beta hydrolase [Oerskovia turbata]|uniref:Alpha/beta hydrolase n=2 Tax=Oerskovia turbata TaxID=1713 RepID=A0A4Q1KQI0_9CELL|nr:alpha/beta hydrolase [Oerskovia turbata]RXR32281.1 alpha/beta hydrolase [Oerskovia turbata]TGJ95120.1 alpha/beta hydrolase [Actinotalea fermentans ATCC 43279 = JCM 9966 = DSM 3133]